MSCNGLILGWGINTPPPTSRKVARRNIKIHHCCKIKKHQISQSNHPNSLIFGGLKEKAPIYIFIKQFSISPHSVEGPLARVSTGKT